MHLTNHSVQRWLVRITELSTLFYHAVLAIPHMFQGSLFVYHANGKLRRFWLVHFRKKYVSQQLSVRQGACRQCGVCCNLLFICPMLTTQGNCVVYGTCRPQACKAFPIDQRDIEEVQHCRSQCGFRFGGEVSDKD